MLDSIKGKSVIVTGAGRGIGRGIALKFAEFGARVVVATRTPGPGEEVVSLIKKAGGEAVLYQTELQSSAVVNDLVDFTAKTYGGVDIVIHNAAKAVLEYIEDLTDKTLFDSFSVNVAVAAWLTRAALPYMRQKGAGRLLFTSSVTSQRAIRGATAYAMTKAGLNGFIRNAAFELGKYNITVNGIEPGITKTDALEKHEFSEEDMRQFLACVPLHCMGTPEDMANAMLFLASDGGRYITGQTIVIDGGMILPENGSMMLRDYAKGNI